MKIYWVIGVLVKEGVKFVCTVFEIAHLFNVYVIVLNFYMIDLYVGSFYEILFCNRCLVKGMLNLFAQFVKLNISSMYKRPCWIFIC